MYAKSARETPIGRGVKKTSNFLKGQKVLAVPVDEVCCFCVMKQTT